MKAISKKLRDSIWILKWEFDFDVLTNTNKVYWSYKYYTLLKKINPDGGRFELTWDVFYGRIGETVFHHNYSRGASINNKRREKISKWYKEEIDFTLRQEIVDMIKEHIRNRWILNLPDYSEFAVIDGVTSQL